MPRVPKAYAVAVQRLRVPSGFLLLAAYLWLARPSLATMAAGLPVAALGLALRAWAAGHLRKNEALVTSGPYAWMRNPLYAGTLITALGFVIAAGQPWLALLFAAAFAFIYGPVMSNEEEHLRTLFREFEDYARRVPLLWPKPPDQPGPGRFEWSLYWRNQEYKAALAFAAAAAFLYWRST